MLRPRLILQSAGSRYALPASVLSAAAGAPRADRGQIDSGTRAFGPYHRGDRRGGIPAGTQLVAVVDDVCLAGERELGACQPE